MPATTNRRPDRPCRARSSGLTPQARDQVLTAVKQLADAVNQIFDTSVDAGQSSFLDDIRQQLKTAVTESFKSSQSNGAFDFGLQFDFSGSGKDVVRFERTEQKQLMSALQTTSGRAALRKLLFAGESQSDGLAERLTTVAKSAERTVSIELGSGAYRNRYRR